MWKVLNLIGKSPIHQAENIRKHFGDRSVEIGRYLLAYVDGLIERLRQWRILDDRNVVLDRFALDTKSEIVLAFCDHHRGPRRFEIVTQGDGNKRMIHD